MEAKLPSSRDGERGVVILLMAFAIVGLIGAASLAIDLGSALVTKAELQNVADAGSLAGTRELAVIYKSLGNNTSYKDYTLTSAQVSQIQNKAITFAGMNHAGGIPIVVGTGDIVTGTYDPKTGDLAPTTKGVRALRVTGRRDGNQNGEFQTRLARVLGINQIGISSEATFALTPLGTLKAGKGEFPVGLDEDWFSSHSCESPETVQFHPTTPSSCAGWHTFDDKPASASRLEKIVEGIEDGTFQSPETTVGETYYEFVGGTIASVLPELKDLFEAKRTPSNATGTWTVTVPVYESSGCMNPNQARLIVGFARLKITDVQIAPSSLVKGDVECGIFDDDELGEGGGGDDYGTLVSSPGMVK